MLTPEEWTALGLSLRVTAWGIVIMLLPAIACAWVLARGRFVGKSVVEAVVHVPLVLPPVVVGFGLLLLLGRNGWVGRWLYAWFDLDIAFTMKAAAIAAAVMGFPLFVRSARLAFDMVDSRVEQAARTLGAGRVRVFCTITLPLALPGVLAGVILAAARMFGEFGATITFAGNIEGSTRTIPVAIYTYTQVPDGDSAAIRLALIAVACSFAAMLVSEILARRVHRRIGLRS